VVSHWRGQGNANDTADGNPGTATGGVTYPAGKIGQAFGFDGVDDVVTVADAANLNPTGGVTLSAWVNFSQCLHTYGWCTVLGKSADGWVFNFEYGLIVNLNGQMSYFQGDGASYFIDYRGSDLRGTGWRHIAVTYDGATVRYYRDGVQFYSTASSVPLTAMGNDVELGGESGEAGGARFKGSMDDVVIFDRALSAAEIQGLYQRRIGGN
jgi:hypothetical protein